jgi:precorrin-6B methylase 1
MANAVSITSPAMGYPGIMIGSAPAVAAFNNTLYVAFQANDPSHHLFITSSTDGVNFATPATDYTGIAIGSAPAMAAFNNRLYIAFQANDSSDSLFITSSADGVNFTTPAQGYPGIQIGGAPAMAVFNNRLYIAFQSNDPRSILFVTSSADGVNFTTPAQGYPDIQMGSSPAIAVFNNQLYVSFYPNQPGHALNVVSSPDGINFNIPVTEYLGIQLGSAPAMTVIGDELYISFQAYDPSHDLFITSSTDGVNFTTPATQYPGIQIGSAPATGAYGPALFVAFQANDSGHILFVTSSSSPGEAPPSQAAEDVDITDVVDDDDVDVDDDDAAEEETVEQPPRTGASLARGDRPFALPNGTRPGRLVVVGSGIKSISQFTLEAVAHIEQADVVFYAVADPATERFIETKNPNSVDLYPLYDDDKPRRNTYTQMAEVMLREVRQGHNVVGVFYGHPGVFVNPSHRAIAIARDEGFEAFMLPGVSAQDVLYADLGIDPSRPGCQTVEATDILIRERPLLTESHVIIFQVGSVGDMRFNFNGFENQHFPVLVDRLTSEYGEQHTLTHYIAAQFPGVEPIIERLTIAQLRQPEIAKRITGISTFYLPPKSLRPGNAAVASKFGLRLRNDNADSERDRVAFPAGHPYGERELTAVAELEHHAIPRNYRRTRTSQAMYDTLYDLATKPEELYAFKRAPAVFVDGKSGLSSAERRALVSRHGGHIRLVMKRTARDSAVEFVERVIRDPALASRYAELSRQFRDENDGATSVSCWLKRRGFEITPEDVTEALAHVAANSLGFFAATYHTVWDNEPGPVIVISKDAVTVDGVQIRGSAYANSVLKWSAAAGNASSAELALAVGSDDRRRTSLDDATGPELRGTYWCAGQTQPGSRNLIGVSGAYTAEGIADGGDPLSAWEGEYQTYVRQSGAAFRPSDGLTLERRDGTISVAHRGCEVKRLRYTGNVASWSVDDGNAGNGSIYFFSKRGAPSEPATNRFFGKIWEADQTPPARSNWLGCAVSLSNLGDAARDAEVEYTATVTGKNVAIGVAALRLWQDETEAGTACVSPDLGGAPASVSLTP